MAFPSALSWRRRRVVATISGLALAYFVLLIPERLPPPAEAPREKPFSWNQNERWLALEERFKQARIAGCDRVAPRIDGGLRRGDRFVAGLTARAVTPHEPILNSVESNLFELGPDVAACLRRLPDYVALVSRTRMAVKRQSERWDLDERATKDRMYRLLWGTRAALEEVMLQGPPGAIPALVPEQDEPSQTPFTRVLGVTIHSGDLLVSRGGAPNSSLIAIGNDYPGKFSHVSLVHVDERTSLASVIQSNQNGVQVFNLEEYLHDIRLRVMVLRLRADLPPLRADPLIPHKAATIALQRARTRHVPYDFEINHHDDTKMYCSEVLSVAYHEFGVHLWMEISNISAPGTRAWLTALGVRHFETQEPSDLEYDPQLRVVAEWRDPGTLYIDHVDNVVTEAMLEGAGQGDRLGDTWYLLPPVRVLKGLSVLLNVFGTVGPVPEGLSAAAAVHLLAFNRRHAAIKRRVLSLADEFRRREGYTPPEWELLRFAKQARDELRS